MTREKGRWLACEDGHIVVLAASSAFFQNLLNNNKKASLLIYLGRVKSEYLEGILDFLYVGEATVEKAHLDEFLAAASEVSIAGLMRQNTETLPKAQRTQGLSSS